MANLQIVVDPFLSDLVYLGGIFPCSIQFLISGEKKGIESCSQLPSPQGNKLSFLVKFTGLEKSYHIYIALHTQKITSPVNGEPSSLVPSKRKSEVLMISDDGDIPPFEIFGTSMEFYLKCMICNQSGFQYVLSFGFEDCDEPHIEGKSSFFSVYQKLDHDYIKTTIGELAYPESISLLKDNKYIIKIAHYIPNLIVLLGSYRLPVIYENPVDQYVVVMIPRFPYHVIEEFEKHKFQTTLSNDNLGENENNNMIGTIKGLEFVISIVSNNSFLSTGPESIRFSFTNSLESFYQVCSKIVGGQSSGDPEKWTTDDILAWVKSTRFAKFENCFQWVRDGEELFSFTAPDLITMGVDPPASVPFVLEINRLKNMNVQSSIINAISNEDQSIAKYIKKSPNFENILTKVNDISILKNISLLLLKHIGEKTKSYASVDQLLLESLYKDSIRLGWQCGIEEFVPFKNLSVQSLFNIFATSIENEKITFFSNYKVTRENQDFQRIVKLTDISFSPQCIPNSSHIKKNSSNGNNDNTSNNSNTVNITNGSKSNHSSNNSNNSNNNNFPSPTTTPTKAATTPTLKPPESTETSTSHVRRLSRNPTVKSGRPTMVEKMVQSFENNDLQNLNMKEISYGLNYDVLLDLDHEEKTVTPNTNTLQNNEQNNNSSTNNNNIISESSDSESEEEHSIIPPLQLQMTPLRDLATIEIVPDHDDFSLHLNLENILLYDGNVEEVILDDDVYQNSVYAKNTDSFAMEDVGPLSPRGSKQIRVTRINSPRQAFIAPVLDKKEESEVKVVNEEEKATIVNKEKETQATGNKVETETQLKQKNKGIENKVNEKKEVVLDKKEVLQVVKDILDKERLNQNDLTKIEKEADIVKLENSNISEVDKNAVLKEQEKLPEDTNEPKPKFEGRKVLKRPNSVNTQRAGVPNRPASMTAATIKKSLSSEQISSHQVSPTASPVPLSPTPIITTSTVQSIIKDPIVATRSILLTDTPSPSSNILTDRNKLDAPTTTTATTNNKLDTPPTTNRSGYTSSDSEISREVEMELENLLLTEECSTPTKFTSPRKTQIDRNSVLSRTASGSNSPLTRTLSGGRPITTLKTPSPTPSLVNSNSPSSPVTPTTSSDKLSIISSSGDIDAPKKRIVNRPDTNSAALKKSGRAGVPMRPGSTKPGATITPTKADITSSSATNVESSEPVKENMKEESINSKSNVSIGNVKNEVNKNEQTNGKKSNQTENNNDTDNKKEFIKELTSSSPSGKSLKTPTKVEKIELSNIKEAQDSKGNSQPNLRAKSSPSSVVSTPNKDIDSKDRGRSPKQRPQSTKIGRAGVPNKKDQDNNKTLPKENTSSPSPKGENFVSNISTSSSTSVKLERNEVNSSDARDNFSRQKSEPPNPKRDKSAEREKRKSLEREKRKSLERELERNEIRGNGVNSSPVSSDAISRQKSDSKPRREKSSEDRKERRKTIGTDAIKSGYIVRDEDLKTPLRKTENDKNGQINDNVTKSSTAPNISEKTSKKEKDKSNQEETPTKREDSNKKRELKRENSANAKKEKEKINHHEETHTPTKREDSNSTKRELKRENSANAKKEKEKINHDEPKRDNLSYKKDKEKRGSKSALMRKVTHNTSSTNEKEKETKIDSPKRVKSDKAKELLTYLSQKIEDKKKEKDEKEEKKNQPAINLPVIQNQPTNNGSNNETNSPKVKTERELNAEKIAAFKKAQQQQQQQQQGL